MTEIPSSPPPAPMPKVYTNPLDMVKDAIVTVAKGMETPSTETEAQAPAKTEEKPPANTDQVAVSSPALQTQPGAADPMSQVMDLSVVSKLMNANDKADIMILRNHLAKGLTEKQAAQFKTNLDKEPPQSSKLTLDPGPPPVAGEYTPKEALSKMAKLLENATDPARRQQLMQHALQLAVKLSDGGGC